MVAIWRLAVLLPLAGPALADVYQWVDQSGATHYGEVVPAEYKASARRVDTGGEPTPEQRQDAEARALREQEAARRIEEQRKVQPAPPAVSTTPASTPPPPANETACEREWRLFAESNECFAPYMMANGAISPEAFKKCTEVKAPTCGPVPPKPATGR